VKECWIQVQLTLLRSYIWFANEVTYPRTNRLACIFRMFAYKTKVCGAHVLFKILYPLFCLQVFHTSQMKVIRLRLLVVTFFIKFHFYEEVPIILKPSETVP